MGENGTCVAAAAATAILRNLKTCDTRYDLSPTPLAGPRSVDSRWGQSHGQFGRDHFFGEKERRKFFREKNTGGSDRGRGRREPLPFVRSFRPSFTPSVRPPSASTLARSARTLSSSPTFTSGCCSFFFPLSFTLRRLGGKSKRTPP